MTRVLRIRSAAGLLLLGIAASPLAGQRVTLSGRSDPTADRRVSALLRRGGYLLITHDTTIPRGDTVGRSVLVAGATLRLDGTVRGDLVGVSSNLFLRPSATVTGDVVNAGGGLYSSEQARLQGDIVDRPLAEYDISRSEGVVAIVGRSPRLPVFQPDGVGGVVLPTYDRVDGLWLRAGGRLRLPRLGTDSIMLRGQAGYRTEVGGLTHLAELTGRRGPGFLTIGHEEVTATNDAWIRSDFKNSLGVLYNGKDYRNYYEAERWFARAGARFASGGWSGEVALLGEREVARSLATGDPWHLLGDSLRFNPPIDPGTIASVGAGADVTWVGRSAAAEIGARTDVAGHVGGGDFAFGRYLIWGDWSMAAIADHALQIYWRAQGPLAGTDSLPRQRWSFVGGSGTLYTFDIAEFTGDRLVFVETRYVIPLPDRLRLPIIGAPDLVFLHTAGMAWTRDSARALEQNVGVELRFFGFSLRAVTNPAHAGRDFEVNVGLSASRGGRRWPFSRFDTAGRRR
ncbi:MAG: hypothetical protein IRZ00_00470 [Gemmatimonadetes bacterium]|nr:hypothetical protein [Gemmatimonadota bacterium]